jgi:hypothetical protein
MANREPLGELEIEIPVPMAWKHGRTVNERE